MKLIVSAQAEASLDAALDFFEAHNPQASGRFLDDVEACFALLRRHAEIGAPTDDVGTRMRLTKRYRYLVYYEILGETIGVLDVQHPSRKRPILGRP